MKKGFTMIELLAVFTITGIILLIAIPQITSLLKKSNDEEYQTFLNSVYIACEAYVEDKNISIDNTYTVTLDDLINTQFLKSTLINPKNKKKVSDDINKVKKITITKDENGILKYQLEG